VLAAVDENAQDKEWLEALAMIVADKPVRSWVDEDLLRFELALSNLVRRFKNLEALQKEVAAKGKGFEAKRITVTEPDGREIHQVVWIDQEYEELIEQLVNKVLNEPELRNNPQLQKAYVARINEKVLSQEAVKSSSEFRKPRGKRRQPAV
jgi:hypothetical protein